MILVYVTNRRLGEVSDIVSSLSEEGRVGYRNPEYFDKPEKCQSVYIHGDWPGIEKAYGDKVIDVVETTSMDSTDYTIAELRKLKPDIEDWEAFTEGDTRKSIDSI